MYFVPPLTGFPLEFGIGAWSRKAGVMVLPDGQKSFQIGLAVYRQYWRVTDGQTDKDRAMQSVARVKITKCISLTLWFCLMSRFVIYYYDNH